MIDPGANEEESIRWCISSFSILYTAEWRSPEIGGRLSNKLNK
jgi:hypothetical protein